MSADDTRAQTQPGGRGRAGYNGGKALPVIRTLREVRVDAGVSMSALEEASGVHRAIISQIERGRLVATREELEAIGAVLGHRIEMRNLAIAVEEQA